MSQRARKQTTALQNTDCESHAHHLASAAPPGAMTQAAMLSTPDSTPQPTTAASGLREYAPLPSPLQVSSKLKRKRGNKEGDVDLEPGMTADEIIGETDNEAALPISANKRRKTRWSMANLDRVKSKIRTVRDSRRIRRVIGLGTAVVAAHCGLTVAGKHVESVLKDIRFVMLIYGVMLRLLGLDAQEPRIGYCKEFYQALKA